MSESSQEFAKQDATIDSGQSVAPAPVALLNVVSWGSNRLDVFVVGSDASLYHKWWNDFLSMI